MKGLIIKEFYNLKQMRNNYFVIVLFLLVYCWLTNKVIFIPIMPILIFGTAIASTFTLDNKVKWEQLIVIGPVTRKEIVTSKYIFLIILILASTILGIILSIPNLLSGAMKINFFIESILLSVDIALCSSGGLIGFVYVFGNAVEKMELLTVFSYVWATAILFVLFKILNFVNQSLAFSRIILISILTIFVILFFLISILVAVKIYEKKDVC